MYTRKKYTSAKNTAKMQNQGRSLPDNYCFGKQDMELYWYDIASRTFHVRWLEHKNDMRDDERQGTALSAKIWELHEAGKPFQIQTEIIRKSHPHKTGDSQCDLCLIEKYRRADPLLSTLLSDILHCEVS